MKTLPKSIEKFFALPQSDHIDALVLAAATAESIRVPSGATRLMAVCSETVFYMKLDGTATIPSGDVTDGTASELQPGLRYLDGAASVSVISPDASVVTLSWYA
jgi:hypothetical protein